MSVRFRRYLQGVERRLEVPYPAREELLRELGGHLDDLYREARAAGLDEGAAVERAIRTLALDEEIVGSLDAVHAPLVRRALAQLPTPLSLALEHAGIGLIAAIAMTVVILEERSMLEFMLDGGLFMIPLNAIGLAILILGGERIVSLYLKKDHSPSNLERRLTSFQFLGLAAALVGLIGTLVGYWQAFSQSTAIAAKHGGVFPIWEVSRIAFTTTIWGLTLALLALCAWYLARTKASRIARLTIRS